MKALLKKKEETGFELEDIEIPEPEDDQVLVKVHSVAICGSDLKLYKWTPWCRNVVKSLPFIPGHEGAGEVVKTGRAVQGMSAGAHGNSTDMKTLRLNGVLMGEIGLEAAIAGYSGVPLVMVSGDSRAWDEAGSLLNDFEGACVKQAAGRSGALCLPPEQTSKIIRERAASAVARAGDFNPYQLKPPYKIEIEFYEDSSASKASNIEGVARRGSRRIAMEGNDLPLLWESFLAKYTA
ncbi:MAG: M55 family metallopeptidase [Spirochaetota bacterium]